MKMHVSKVYHHTKLQDTYRPIEISIQCQFRSAAMLVLLMQGVNIFVVKLLFLSYG
jgi:hypothetical protein